MQDADPGRDPRHLAQQVAGQQDGDPVVTGQVGEHGPDLHDTGRVQTVDRLVQYQDAGPVQERLGQPQPLGVTQRQGPLVLLGIVVRDPADWFKLLVILVLLAGTSPAASAATARALTRVEAGHREPAS